MRNVLATGSRTADGENVASSRTVVMSGGGVSRDADVLAEGDGWLGVPGEAAADVDCSRGPVGPGAVGGDVEREGGGLVGRVDELTV